MRDVQPGKTHAPRRQQQIRQRLHAEMQLFQVDLPVQVAHPLLIALALVQRGRAAALDALADQADQERRLAHGWFASRCARRRSASV
jgi:hypothetical protein